MKIAVSNRASSFAELAAQALAQARWADLVELRLDGVFDGALDGALDATAKFDPEALARLIRELGKPVIVALNGPEAFGSFQGSSQARFEILRAAARAGAAWVDVDARYARELGALACARIVSRHERQGTPDDLGTLLRELASLALPGDAIKLVTHANSAEDGLRMLAALRAASGSRIGFCSGEVGRFTRELCCAFGSSWTYAAPAGVGEATAPGQVRVDELRASWPARWECSADEHGSAHAKDRSRARGSPREEDGATRFLGVIGRPARHSLSPRLFNAELRAQQLDALYGCYEAAEFASFWRALPDERFAGFSVTAPFKRDALAVCASLDESARAMRAVNTLVRTRAGWHGANTDIDGVRAALGDVRGARALVLGAGGAARAAVFALRSGGAQVFLAARETARAEALGAEAGAFDTDADALDTEIGALDSEVGAGESIVRGQAADAGVQVLRWDALDRVRCDVLVHCTPLGSLAEPGALPIPLELLRPGMRVLDAVYRPSETSLLAAARARGCVAIRGNEWFLAQAAAQFRLFTGCEPDAARLRRSLEELSR